MSLCLWHASTEVKPPPEAEGMDRSEIEESAGQPWGLSYNLGTPKPWLSIAKTIENHGFQ